MKKLERMTKAELIRCIKALEKGAPAVGVIFEHERLLHELQVQQVELEAQNRELRDAQFLLEGSRDRYADLYDFAPVGFVTFNDKGVIREVNSTAAGMLGVERTRLVGVPFHLHVAREDLTLFREHLARLSSPDERITTELRLRGSDDVCIPVVMQSVLFYDEENRTYLCRTALTDITVRKQAEQALRESSELNRGILCSLSAHIAVLDGAGNIIAVNEAWNRFAGANSNDSPARCGVGTNYLEVCRQAVGTPDVEARNALEGIAKVLRGETPSFSMEYACDSPDVRRRFQMSVTPLSAGGQGAVISHLDISQRCLAEEALAEKEARLRAVLDSAVEGIITIDEHGTIESLNQAAEKLFGYGADEAIGQNVNLLMPSPYREHHDGYLKHYGNTGERLVIGVGREVSGRRKDGSTFPLELSVSEVQIAGRRIFTGFLRDLTRRKQAEEALRASEARFRSLSEASPLGICMADPEGRCTYTNPRWQEISGLSSDENLGDGWTKVIYPEDRQALIGAWNKAMRTGEFAAEFRILRPDGVVRWIQARAKSIVGTDGKLAGYVSVDEDISARKCEEQRRQVQYEIAHLLAVSGTLGETVPKLLRLMATTLGWDVGEFWELSGDPKKLRMLNVWHVPRKKLEAFVKHSLKLSLSMFDGLPGRVLATRKPQWIPDIAQCPHFIRRRAAAQSGLRSALAFPIRIDKQTIALMAFLTHRATELDKDLLEMFASLGSQIGQFMERKRTEEALREANEFGRQVIDGAEAGIIVCDQDGKLTVWNPFMEQITGYRADEVRGRLAREIFPFLAEQHFSEMFERALAGESFEAEDIHIDLPDKKKKVWMTARFAPLRDARQEVAGVIVAVRDITDRRRLESELLEISDREQQRIGHDLHDGLGQQLTAIELMCHLLREDLSAGQPLLEQRAIKMGEALREAIAQTRALSRGLSPVNLQSPEGLTESLRELARSTGVVSGLKCRFLSPAPVLIASSAVAGQLYRIAQEAVNNALKHGRPKRIDIELSSRNEAVRLRISDDGKGLSKSRKPGRGMGLEVMKHRANIVGGKLLITSKRGEGVTVDLTLPPGKP